MKSLLFAVALLFACAIPAQTLAPVESAGVSMLVVAVVGVACLVGGFFVGKKFQADPAAGAAAQAEVLTGFSKVHAALDALVARIERHPAPAAPAAPPAAEPPPPPAAPAMTPEQLAAARATIAHLQSVVAAADAPATA